MKIKNILGFSTINYDLNFDYQLSLSKGILTKNRIVKPFYANEFHNNCIIPYRIYHCLGVGGFSKVYLGRSYQDGKFYAMKFIRRNNHSQQIEDQKLQQFLNEINISHELNHPFLVQFHHSFASINFYCMVFEYCPGGELFYLLRKMQRMTQKICRFYFLQILSCLSYLHHKCIIYRDIKPENIMIDSNGNLKIIDFGLAKKINHFNRYKTFSFCGSTQYMAPQMLLKCGHSFSLDYYSLGALLYELNFGLPPFYNTNIKILKQQILTKKLQIPYKYNSSEQLKDLLQKLLTKDNKLRLGSYAGIKQILIHPWIGRINLQQIENKQQIPPYQPNLNEINFDTNQFGKQEQQFTKDIMKDMNRNINKNQIKKAIYNFILPQKIYPINQYYINKFKSNTMQFNQKNIKISSIRKQKTKRNNSKILKQLSSNYQSLYTQRYHNNTNNMLLIPKNTYHYKKIKNKDNYKQIKKIKQKQNIKLTLQPIIQINNSNKNSYHSINKNHLKLKKKKIRILEKK